MKQGSGSPTKTAFRLHLEYDGGRYQGWQKQGQLQTAQGVKTVAGTLERVLHQAGYQVLNLTGSGRTDAGVHALDQVAHLHMPKSRETTASTLLRTLNDSLPSDVVVTSLEPCPASFHARHDAVARTYVYQISQRRSAFAKPYIWWVKRHLDIHALEDAWRSFQGFHDVTSFADLDQDDDPRCEIQACDFRTDGAVILLRVTASHFLRKQVRRMVGAAVTCGLGQERPSKILRDLMSPSPAITLAWSEKAAPASGLFLAHVQYSGQPELGPLEAITPMSIGSGRS
jgi:tRNA pseudouridine38-40 synthase